MTIKQYLVVDDNEADIAHLTTLLAKFPLGHLAAVANSVEAAIEVLAARHIDLIFLDVNLQDQSGLTLLKAGIPLPPVIIISAHPEYAADSYEIGKAADFVVKPYVADRLHLAITRALQLQGNASRMVENEAIFLKMGRKIQRFNYQSIEYAEAFGIYSKVFLGEQMNLVNERLSALTKALPAHLFIRVHKSYLINVTKITSYDRNNLWLGKAKIPIGISYRSRLEGLLSLFATADEPEQ